MLLMVLHRVRIFDHLLNNEDNSKRLLANKITNHFSFTKSVGSIQSYPSSLMGMMALLRQMYLDLDWYKKFIHN
jgi:hypothetical protein